MSKEYKHGQIVWRDLTVENMEEVKGFYEKVCGWETSDHDMGEYSDYNVLIKETKDVIAGIIYKRGVNMDIPSQWLLYVYVDSVKKSLEQALNLGGEIIVALRKMGPSDFAVIKDPAGAVIALIH